MEDQDFSRIIELTNKEFEEYKKEEKKSQRRQNLKSVLYVLLYLFVCVPMMVIVAWVITKPLEWINAPRWAYQIFEYVVLIILCIIAYYFTEGKYRKKRKKDKVDEWIDDKR